MSLPLDYDDLHDFIGSVIAQGELARDHLDPLKRLYASAEAFERIAGIIAENGNAEVAYRKIVDVVWGTRLTERTAPPPTPV